MTPIDRAEAELQRLVGAGKLVGFVAGVREAGRSWVAAGGMSAVDGPPMSEDAVFPLSSNTKPVGGLLAMRLVELGLLGLDDPVGEHLPELADPRVLARPDGPLEETVPAERAITLRHLLTMTAGFGWAGEGTPLAGAMAAQQVAPGPYAPPMPPDEYLRRLGALPLAGQPGQGWNYHNSSDVLGVLLARATGSAVPDLVAEHVTGPLGTRDTGFTAAPGRLVASYGADPSGGLRALDTAGRFGEPPAFASLACGLAATVADYLLALEALVAGAPVLAPETAAQMCTDQLTAAQRAAASGIVEPGSGYGFQVETRPDGAVGWAGGLGTIGYADRDTGRAAAVFTNQGFDVEGATEALDAVWGLLS